MPRHSQSQLNSSSSEPYPKNSMTLIGNLVVVAFIGLNVLTLSQSTHHEKDTFISPETKQNAASEYEALKAKLSENYHRAAAKFDEIVGDEDAKRLHEEALMKARVSSGGQQINQQMGQSSDAAHEAGATFVDKIKQWAGMKEQGSSVSEDAKEAAQNVADRLKEDADSADHGAKTVYEKIKEWSGVAGEKATEVRDKAAGQANDMGNFAQGQYERGKESLDATKRQASQLYDESKYQATSTFDEAKTRASRNYQAAMDKAEEALERQENSQTLFGATKQRASDAYETARDTIQGTLDAAKQRANENYGVAKEAVQETLDATKQRASDAYRTVGDTTGKVYDSTTQNLNDAQERVGEMYEATKDAAGETQQRVGGAYVAAKEKLQGN